MLWWGGRSIAPRVLPLVAAIHALGPLGPILFTLLYIVAIVALVPASWLTVAGGAVFGVGAAFVCGLVGTTVGSTIALLVGRYVAWRVVARRLESMPRVAAIDRAVSAQGRRIVFLLRLSPVAPFNVLNYALGLTTISVRDFAIASAIGMIPSTLLYAYAGQVAGEAIALAGQAQVPHSTSYYAILCAGLAATVAVTTVVTRAARRALRDV